MMRLSPSSIAILSFIGLSSAEERDFPPIFMDRQKNSAFTFLMNDAIQGFFQETESALASFEEWTKYLNEGDKELIEIVEEGFNESELLAEDEDPPYENFFCPKAALLLQDDLSYAQALDADGDAMDFGDERDLKEAYRKDTSSEELKNGVMPLLESCMSYEFTPKFEPLAYFRDENGLLTSVMDDRIKERNIEMGVPDEEADGPLRKKGPGEMIDRVIEKCLIPAVRYACLKQPSDESFGQFIADGGVHHGFEDFGKMFKMGSDDGTDECRGIIAFAHSRKLSEKFGSAAEVEYRFQLHDGAYWPGKYEDREKTIAYCKLFNKCTTEGYRAVCGYGTNECVCLKEYTKTLEDYIKLHSQNGRRLLAMESA